MSVRVALLCLTCLSLRAGASADYAPHPPPGYADFAQDFDLPARESVLQAARRSGDLHAQRRHLWQVLAALTRQDPGTGMPAFLTWYSAGEVFSSASPETLWAQPRAMPLAFQLPGSGERDAHPTVAPPLIVRAHYNWVAARHIRDLNLKTPAGSIPEFPRSAVIVKSVWWPVPARGMVAIPVWDPSANAARAGGNDYPSWSRVVATSTEAAAAAPGAAAAVGFFGKAVPRASRVGIERFYHIKLDQALADELMRDAEARKAALMLLGRPLRARDVLALVGLHVATREMTDWVWGTVWWHDAPDQGPYATLRPDTVIGPWRNYLMNVAFDADLPREADGTPHIVFNPWLEARLPDSGNGSGIVSNCMACHQRASLARDAPFRVTRGSQAVAARGTASTALRTSSLWSIPLQVPR